MESSLIEYNALKIATCFNVKLELAELITMYLGMADNEENYHFLKSVHSCNLINQKYENDFLQK